MRRRGLRRGAPEKSADGRRGYGIVTASSSPLSALPQDAAAGTSPAASAVSGSSVRSTDAAVSARSASATARGGLPRSSGSGFTVAPELLRPLRTSKWRWGPEELPVFPDRPISWPAATRAPTGTCRLLRWA